MKKGILVLILAVISLLTIFAKTIIKLLIKYKIISIPKPIIIVLIIIAILLFLFWLWMLIDAIRSDNDEKVFWIGIILIFNFLGALFYFFQVKRRSHQKIK